MTWATAAAASSTSGILGSTRTVMLCLAVAVAAVLVSDLLRAWVIVPAVVLEIVGGIVIGPDVLRLARADQVVSAVSWMGLTVLMFLAGYEMQLARLRGGPLRAASLAWVVSLALGLLAGGLLSLVADAVGAFTSGLVLGLALTTTALSTILPILRDSGDLDTTLGRYVLAAGAVGEFGPIIAIAVLLSGQRPLRTAVVLLVFTAVAALALAMAARPRRTRLHGVVRRTLRSSGQLVVRLTMFVLLLLVWVAGSLGLDVLLGAFTAGVVAHAFLTSEEPEIEREALGRVEGIGFGFVIPVFFVVTGIRFDLDALLSDPGTFLLVPVFLALFLLVRGLPTGLTVHRTLPRSERGPLMLYASTALPLVVVITTIGVEDKVLPSAGAAALVGAAMISVLMLPLVALRWRARTAPPRLGDVAP